MRNSNATVLSNKSKLRLSDFQIILTDFFIIDHINLSNMRWATYVVNSYPIKIFDFSRTSYAAWWKNESICWSNLPWGRMSLLCKGLMHKKLWKFFEMSRPPGRFRISLWFQWCSPFVFWIYMMVAVGRNVWYTFIKIWEKNKYAISLLNADTLAITVQPESACTPKDYSRLLRSICR